MRARSWRGVAFVASAMVAACGGSEFAGGSDDASVGADGTVVQGDGAAADGASLDGGMAADAPADAHHGGKDAGAADAPFDGNNAPSCPSSVDAATGECAPTGLACSYPQGTCDCAWVTWCGGPPPQPGWDGGAAWSCMLHRTDGCPDMVPKSGDPCGQAGQVCNYGTCCITRASCQNGQWMVGPPLCPG